jgi:hypothetical protein
MSVTLLLLVACVLAAAAIGLTAARGLEALVDTLVPVRGRRSPAG